jgi:hypothetical protein
VLWYSCSAGGLRKRLTLQGFGFQAVVEGAVAYVAEVRDDDDRYMPAEWAAIEDRHPTAASLFDAWLRWRHNQPGWPGPRIVNEEDRYFASEWESLIEVFDDPRFELSLVLARTRGRTPVTLDLSNLRLGGWLDDNEPHRSAHRRLANEVAASGPVIVVTEGRTDARILERVVSLIEPDLRESFAFLDFEGTSVPGGVDRVVSLTRGMAAAKVMNRVVAVLDNDTAGRAAAATLAKSSLPARMRVTVLPALEYAESYPTKGPDAPV